MVHALEEIRRVLAPGGTLLDLRPLADRWPVEIVFDGSSVETGRLNDLPTGLGDDQAANIAVETVIQRDLFRRISEIYFPLNIYWDNPDEMTEYVSKRWTDFVQLGSKIQKTTRTAWKASGNKGRVRVKLKMLLTHLQKY